MSMMSTGPRTAGPSAGVSAVPQPSVTSIAGSKTNTTPTPADFSFSTALGNLRSEAAAAPTSPAQSPSNTVRSLTELDIKNRVTFSLAVTSGVAMATLCASAVGGFGLSAAASGVLGYVGTAGAISEGLDRPLGAAFPDLKSRWGNMNTFSRVTETIGATIETASQLISKPLNGIAQALLRSRSESR